MRRALRYLLLTAAAAVAVIVVAPATPPGRGVVVGMIERAVAGSGLTISVEGSSGWLPFSFGARRIVVADADGPFADVTNLRVDIKTTALLVGRLALDSLNADRVDIARQPHLAGGGSGGAALPFAADAVSIARLELGAAIAGRQAALSLAGSLTTGAGGRLAGRVNAERMDGRTGSLVASFDRANASAPFAIDAKLSEDADGILVGLIGRATGPGYTLAASTSVNGDGLDGVLSLSSNGAASFAGKFSVSPLGNAGRRIVVTGGGDLAELVPAEYADLLSGPIALAVDADWTPGAGVLPTIAVRQGSLSTGNVHAEVSGSLSDTVADLALKLDAAKVGDGPISVPLTSPPSQVDTISIAGKVAPAKDTIRLELTGRVAGLSTGAVTIPGLGLSLALEAPKDDPLAGGKLPFAARVEADAVQTATGRIESVGGAPIVLTADGSFDTGTVTAEMGAKLAVAGGNATFVGTVSADAVKGTATADFGDLSTLRPLVGRPVAGGIAATATGTLIAPQSAFRLEATATNLDPGEATLAKLFAGETRIAATLGTKSEGFTVDDFTIAGAAFTAIGQASLASGTITGTAKGGVPDLSLLADASSGAGTFEATVSGAIARPTIDATISIPSGRLLDQPIENGAIHVAAAPADPGWQAALTLAGSLAGKPLAGKANATLDAAGRLAFPTVDLAIGDNRIVGAVARTADGPLSGTLAVTAPNLQTLAALALTTASGSGEARIALAPDGERQSLAISFSADSVAYQAATAAKISGDLHVDDVFGTPLIRGNATATGMVVGGLRLDTADVTASIEGAATRFSAKAKGSDLELSGSGTLGGAAGGSVVRLDALTGQAFGLPVALNAPVTLNLGGGASAISGAVLALGGGTVRVDGAVAPALNLTVAINDVAASVANGFAPTLGAEGTITGQARITGSAAAPVVAWQGDWQGLRVAATRNAGLPGLVLSARGNATATTTSISARLTGAGLALDIAGNMPFSGPGLAVKANGTAPLALLALESNRELRLAGTARVNLALSGSLVAVATAGTVDLADATIADTNTGFGIAGATGRITFDGQRATIQQLSGRLAQGGDITVAGSVAIGEPGLPAALTVKIANGRYADGKTINATFNAGLAVNGPILGNGTVSGTVNLGRTEIQLPDRLAGSATAIDVRHVNVPRGFVPPKARETATGGGPASAGGGGLRLDIALTASSGLFVRGFGIDSELGGSLRLTGTSGSPQTVGAFQMSRGRIEALGRRFDFQSGEMTFAGDLIPYLDFSATSVTSDATVTLNVTGPANNPAISFTSSPDLPEEEILSRLLFDRSVGSLSPLQAAQLVDAVAQLTGAVGGGGLFARVREATGLDDLDIRQSATGGTTVGVAKRISDKVRVGVEAGTDAAAGRVVIDLDITKNLKARGEAGQDGAGKVGLTYEQEYYALKIVDIRITPIAISDPPLLNSVGVHAPYALRLVTEIVSDDGIIGIYETPGGVKIETGLRHAAPRFDGHDPFDFNRLTRVLDEAFTAEDDGRGTNPWDQRLKKHVMSALEVACYDLIGKATEKRVAELLGGVVRERVPYAGYLFFKLAGAGGRLGFGMDAAAVGWPAARQAEAVTPQAIVAQAEAMIAAYGFRSLKLKGGAFDPEIEVGAMEALARRFGPKVPLRFDPNAVWTVATAIAAGKRMKGFLEYYEDPVRGQAAMAEVGRALGIPMATNMCTTSFEDLPESIRLHSEDVILSDHHFWGGFRPCLELAAMCRTFGRGLSMHSNSHLGVSLMAMTHLAAAAPNLTYDLDTHYPWQSEEIAVGGTISFEDGHVRLPDAPGLGVELDQTVLAALHKQYFAAGLKERDDEIEMRKLHPEFRANLVRF